ncbi:unnamed protein product [Dovyalis caffra]|uniref:Uncharacterized protein n=1 Tax=Dovyalis caffra TaxID=77055 RepID=A0AAV1RLD0_9ROSI|nr:unnamed protein product [Dovyalis caffra]
MTPAANAILPPSLNLNDEKEKSGSDDKNFGPNKIDEKKRGKEEMQVEPHCSIMNGEGGEDEESV